MTPLLAQRPRTDRAFERLYRKHVGDVYRYALAVMRNPADAEDVTQTTFMNAYRAYSEKGNRPEKPQNWLIAIAHNVCRQRFRQTARRPAEVSFEDDIADSIPDEDAPTGDDIRRALGHLAFNQRAALVMRELEGRSYVEIGEILNLSTSAVETLIFRARRALREQLEGSLTCGDAELAISRQLDGRLSRGEKGQLRAHLRECPECATFARRQRAQRSALKTLALIPVPSSLASFFGGGGTAVGTGLALKAAVAVTAGLVIGGAGLEGAKHAPWRAEKPAAAAPAPIVASVAPDANMPAPREHMPVLPEKSHGSKGLATAAAAHAKPKNARHANGRTKHILGDASVASRHVKPTHAVHPSHPTRPPTPVRVQKAPPVRAPKPTPAAKPQPNEQLPPGPFDTTPPGQGKSHKP
jgi:RNA polymerase sigma-70 factor, ECF subfamily